VLNFWKDLLESDMQHQTCVKIANSDELWLQLEATAEQDLREFELLLMLD
jgi:hypothetical protein